MGVDLRVIPVFPESLGCGIRETKRIEDTFYMREVIYG